MCAKVVSIFAASPSSLFCTALEASSRSAIPVPIFGHWSGFARRLLSQAAGPAALSGAAPGGAQTSPPAAAAPGAPAAAPTLTTPPHLGSIYESVDLADDVASTPPVPPTLVSPALPSRSNLPRQVLQDLRPPTQPYQLAPKLAQRPTRTPALYTPWTPTRALQRRALLTRRMGFLMNVLEREQELRIQAARPLPDFRAGDVLEVRVLVPEAERKVALYRGVCIARYDKGLRSTFKIYNVYPDCGGVVQHLPLYMPDLLGIKVVGRIPCSQERLFYLLERESAEYTFQTGVITAK